MKRASRPVEVAKISRHPAVRQPTVPFDRPDRLTAHTAHGLRPSAGRFGYQHFDEQEIRRVARERGPGDSILLICARMVWHEARLRFNRRINFRREVNLEACAAYCTMQLEEFSAINARQAWANWRTIPRNLTRRLPSRPVFAVDLCCGVGDSTEVLSYYCAPGSVVLGLEYNPQFVTAARSRRFYDRESRIADTRFHAQSVLETFCDSRGERLADESVDLVNASGAIGCHFGRTDLYTLARECRRVVRPGGLALIDSSRSRCQVARLASIFAAEGLLAIHQASSSPLDRFTQLCLRKAG